MKRSFLVRSILAGLAGVLILVLMMAISGFMADQEMKEYYKVPRGYDNDFVGIEWFFLFFFVALCTFVLIGALAAWAVRDQAPSVKDTLKASAIAGAVPIILILIGSVVLFLFILEGSPNPAAGIIFGILEMAMLSPMIIGTLAGCIVLSLIGGLAYTMLVRPVIGGRIVMPAWKMPLLIGMAGGAIILAFHAIDTLLNHGVFSFGWGLAGVLVFFAVALLSGALAVTRSKRPDIRLAGALLASLLAGLVAGLGRAIGCAPLKIIVMITVCIVVAIIYSALIKGQKYDGNEAA